jgi:ATP phosphoribosyltransferase
MYNINFLRAYISRPFFFYKLYTMSENLKIAVQKKGRLYDGSMTLLKECGIDVSNGNNQLRVQAANFPLEVFFLRDDDIP